jgi:hypothetical protein
MQLYIGTLCCKSRKAPMHRHFRGTEKFKLNGVKNKKAKIENEKTRTSEEKNE